MHNRPPVITLENRRWERIPIRTRLILRGDDLLQAIEEGLEAAGETPEENDILS